MRLSCTYWQLPKPYESMTSTLVIFPCSFTDSKGLPQIHRPFVHDEVVELTWKLSSADIMEFSR